MAEQADRTLLSLGPAYQRDVDPDDYEVVVVENRSDELLGEERATRHGGNVRYFCRDETERTPVHAVNFGAGQARAGHLTIMIDGARMVTPGLVRNTLDVFAMSPDAVVTVPSYHLGDKLQQIAVDEGYTKEADAERLRSIAWPEDGYRLFEIAVFAASCRNGLFAGSWESNALSMSAERWRRIEGMNPRYNDFGGGTANLDLYKRALESPGTPVYLLFGEGSFHQFHGGVTTGTTRDVRAPIIEQIHAQDRQIRGEDRQPPSVQPILYGRLHPPAYPFVKQSLGAVGAL
jgi:hypothetical protein